MRLHSPSDLFHSRIQRVAAYRELTEHVREQEQRLRGRRLEHAGRETVGAHHPRARDRLFDGSTRLDAIDTETVVPDVDGVVGDGHDAAFSQAWQPAQR